MKKFFNLLKKDIRELITPELILPLVIMIVLLNFVGKVVSTETKKATSAQSIVVLNLDNGNYSEMLINILKQGQFKVVDPGTEDEKQAVSFAEENKFNVVVVIPDEFSSQVLALKQPKVKVYSIFRGIGIAQLSQPSIVKNIFAFINDSLSKEFIKEKFFEVDPSFVQSPIKMEDYVVVNGKTAQVSPESILQAFSSRFLFIPIILMIVILFSAQMLASLVAMEKQNKTLETLLTVPVKRPLIVLSKMLSAAVVSLIISIVYMFGFTGYIQGITGGQITSSAPQATEALAKLGLTFTPFYLSIIGISLFFAILSALAVATILAVYAQDVKDAQALLTPLMVLLILPYFLTMFTDAATLPLSLRALLYAIPFAHPFLAIQNLLFGRITPVILGIIYEIIFSAVCIYIATKIFSSDRILTARVKFRKISFRR